jgi:GntR family transcriptional regulator of arabinose operon
VRRVGSGTYAAESAKPGNFVFGLLIPDLGQTEIFEPICRGIARSPQSKRHSLLWGHSVDAANNRADQARELCDYYMEQKVDGVFFAPLEFMPPGEGVNFEILERLKSAKVRVVLLDRCVLPLSESPECDLVGLDNLPAGFVVTKHLLAMGAQRVAFLAREGSVETVEARLIGCREALLANGRSLEETIVMHDEVIDEPAVSRLIKKRRIDAVVCANDHTAAKLMKALLNQGLGVPQDVRVVGFDDVSYGSLLHVPLTTIHQPCDDIGSSAMGAMIDRIRNPDVQPRRILLRGGLVVRRSCGAHNTLV